MKKTQSEFIKEYCEASGVSEKELNDMGTFAMICDCELGERHWVMVRGDDALKHHLELYVDLKEKRDEPCEERDCKKCNV